MKVNPSICSSGSMFGSQVRQQGRPEVQSDASPSDGAQKKAQAAKSYIENMYKVQYQNIQQRADRQASVALVHQTYEAKCPVDKVSF